MLKRIISILLLSAIILSFGACGENGDKPAVTTAEPADVTESSARKDGEILDPENEYSILFIGNSYTYYNDMPEVIFKEITEAAGYTFSVKSITKGGWDLERYGSAEDEMGAVVDAELKNTKYDFVVIQDHSHSPARDHEKFYSGFRAVLAKVRENGASPLLYGTWGWHEEHSFLEENGLTTESMTWKMAAAYEAISEETGVPVAHAGLAFRDVHTNNSDRIDVYANDLYHPSYSGSYLAAMTIFAKLTGVDPTTVDYQGERAKPIADVLKEAARKAVFETPAISDEYKTTTGK